MQSTDIDSKSMFKEKVLGHPAGLFVLFFTEMWERFSYYGMRALLIMFFTASIAEGGWQWEKGHAMAIFGTYTSLVYISTLLGGYFADKVVGYRYAVLIGALLMTFGHAAMAVESPFFIYTGLVLLVFGSGFFKPNMTSIVAQLYKSPELESKKDGAYTIFYMGVNSGAFFGIESFNHASAKSIGKGLHPDKVIEELYKFNDLLPHCGTTGSFIVGLPHETIETVARQKEQLLDPAFPIDNILMYPLTLDHSRKHNLSEFEKNTAKYFKIRSSDPDWWHNGHFDVDWAKNFCRTFFDHNPERNRVGGFQVATLHNYYPNQKIVGVPNYTVSPTLTQQQNKLAEYKFRLFGNG
jgi:hypothetical protein